MSNRNSFDNLSRQLSTTNSTPQLVALAKLDNGNVVVANLQVLATGGGKFYTVGIAASVMCVNGVAIVEQQTTDGSLNKSPPPWHAQIVNDGSNGMVLKLTGQTGTVINWTVVGTLLKG